MGVIITPLHVVLYQPEIPPNTGNIARLCAATGAHLHLIRPLGFSVDDKQLKRAGLDYWHLLSISYHDSFPELREQAESARFFYLTTRAERSHTEQIYTDGDFLVFGPETRGLPAAILEIEPEHNLRIPMISDARSLNLSNSVAVVVYEALRQLGYPGLR